MESQRCRCCRRWIRRGVRILRESGYAWITKKRLAHESHEQGVLYFKFSVQRSVDGDTFEGHHFGFGVEFFDRSFHGLGVIQGVELA